MPSNIKNLSDLQLKQYETLFNQGLNLIERNLAKQYLIALQRLRSDLIELTDKQGKLSNAEAARFNRLLSLNRNIEDNLNDLIKQNVTSINSVVASSYDLTYYSYSWTIDVNAEVRLDWGLLNPESIQRAIENPYSKVAWDKYLKGANLKVKEVINQAIIKGDGIKEVTKILKAVLGAGYNKARRIARTEIHRIMEQAAQDQFKYARDTLKIDLRKMLVSTLDTRTRPQSAQMDGDISNENGEFLYPDGRWHIPGNTGNAKWDVNDRERSIEIIEDYGPIIRRTKEDGVIPYENFEKWATDKGITHNIYGEKLF